MTEQHTLYYLGIIEGALHQKGEDAYSIKVWHALRMLGRCLGAPGIAAAELPVGREVAAAVARGLEAADPPPDGARARWQDWQVNLLREMKGKGETPAAIAAAVEKTVPQVNSKWFTMNHRNTGDTDEAEQEAG